MLEGGSTAKLGGSHGRGCAISGIRGRVPTFGRNGNLEHKKQLLDMATAWDSVARHKKSELAAANQAVE